MSSLSHPLLSHEETTLHYSLNGLLTQNNYLALNTQFGTLSLLTAKDGRPIMLAQQQFTSGELSMLMPLFDAYPYYCPHEVLLAGWSLASHADAAIARSRQRLHEAAALGVWDQEMRPVRSALSRVRLKLRTLDLDITSILTTGYQLTRPQQFKHTRSI